MTAAQDAHRDAPAPGDAAWSAASHDGAPTWHDYFEARELSQAERCAELEEAYRQVQAERMRIGLARLNLGYNLLLLKNTGAWRGRTGASSFRRFLIEEGLEPKAAHQYMAVAQAYLIEHGVDPTRIARVSMRLLVASIPKLTLATVEDVVTLLASLPAAEAKLALEEAFPDVLEESLEPGGLPPLPKTVHRILDVMDGMSFDERRELYRVLHLRSSALPDLTSSDRRTSSGFAADGANGPAAAPDVKAPARRSLFAQFAARAAAADSTVADEISLAAYERHPTEFH